MVLTLLRMGPVMVPTGSTPLMVSGRGDHMTPLYTTAAAPMSLHGVPLTSVTLPAHVPGQRLQYSDPYTSAYVSMLTSMYGLSIAV